MRCSEIALTLMVILLMISNYIVSKQRDEAVQALQTCEELTEKEVSLISLELDSVFVNLHEIRSSLYGEGPE